MCDGLELLLRDPRYKFLSDDEKREAVERIIAKSRTRATAGAKARLLAASR